MDPEPDSDLKLDLDLTKNHPKNKQFYIMTLKYINLTFSFCFQIYKKSFKIVGIVKEWMFRVGSETGSETFY
jgi:hypothetical protein